MNVDDVMLKICDRCKYTYINMDPDDFERVCAACAVEADIKVLVAKATVAGRAAAADEITAGGGR